MIFKSLPTQTIVWMWFQPKPLCDLAMIFHSWLMSKQGFAGLPAPGNLFEQRWVSRMSHLASPHHQPDSPSGVKSFYELLDVGGNQLMGAQHLNKAFSPHQVDLVIIELAWQGASIYNFVYNLVCREYFVLLQRNLIFSIAEGNDDFCPTRRGLQGLIIK